jgi:hypothetical protein
MLLPMPRAAPVTKQTFPSRRFPDTRSRTSNFHPFLLFGIQARDAPGRRFIRSGVFEERAGRNLSIRRLALLRRAGRRPFPMVRCDPAPISTTAAFPGPERADVAQNAAFARLGRSDEGKRFPRVFAEQWCAICN